MLENCQVSRNGGGHAFDNHLVESTNGARNCHVTVASPHDQLADQVVVVLADRIA